jgi:hypothetical protein
MTRTTRFVSKQIQIRVIIAHALEITPLKFNWRLKESEHDENNTMLQYDALIAKLEAENNKD